MPEKIDAFTVPGSFYADMSEYEFLSWLAKNGTLTRSQAKKVWRLLQRPGSPPHDLVLAFPSRKVMARWSPGIHKPVGVDQAIDELRAALVSN